MNRPHNFVSALLGVLRAGLLLVAATTLIACGSGEQTPEDQEQYTDESHEGEEQLVRLSADELHEFGIALETASPGTLDVTVSLPGEVRVNQDRFAHIVPRIPGFVHSANKSVGDIVRAGEVLAILDSRDLADIKSDYLTGLERLELAESTFEREEQLFKKKISSEQEFLEAQQGMAEARIVLRSARQKLLALGFSENYITALPEQPEYALVHYQMTAPLAGVVIEKHVSQGEALNAHDEAFAIADLSTVWVDLNVFQKDLDVVREGQLVDIVTTGRRLRKSGTIQFVLPIVGEDTRTAIARIVLDNQNGRWRPGLFVSGSIAIGAIEAPVVVPRSALVTLDDKVIVFVQTDEGLSPSTVTVGRETETMAEITAGLLPGSRYVARGGFALKAELEKDEFGEADED